MASVNLQRRALFNAMYLQEVVESGPKVEVTWSLEAVRSSVRALADQGMRPDLIAKLFRRTGDDELRMECVNALHKMDSQASRAEMARLISDPEVAPKWRGTFAGLLHTTPPAGAGADQ